MNQLVISTELVSKLYYRQLVFVTYYSTMNTDDYALMIKLSGVEFYISWCFRLRSLAMGGWGMKMEGDKLQ